MKKLMLLPILAIVAGCSMINPPQTTKYVCGAETVEVTYLSPKELLLKTGYAEHELYSAISASGARYINDEATITFWNKGNENSLEIRGSAFSECKPVA